MSRSRDKWKENCKQSIRYEEDSTCQKLEVVSRGHMTLRLLDGANSSRLTLKCMEALDGFMSDQHKHAETPVSEWLLWLFSRRWRRHLLVGWGISNRLFQVFELKMWGLNQDIRILVANIFYLRDKENLMRDTKCDIIENNSWWVTCVSK